MIWAALIVILFLLFAILFAKVGAEVIEDSDVFLIITGGFVLCFMGAGFALSFFLRSPSSASDVAGLMHSIVQPVFASSEDLSL